jgi:hypothetical protein
MAITLTTSNSFVTEAEAVTITGTLLNVTAWTSSLTENQKKALIQATNYISTNFSFQYLKVDPNQALEFPRYLPLISAVDYTGSLYSIDGINYVSTTPSEIKRAVVLEAIALLATVSNVHLDNQAIGIKSINFQGDSVQYGSNKTGGMRSKEAYNLVKKFVGVSKVVC